MIDWDNIEIICEDTEIIKTSDCDIINVDCSDRMIVFSGEPGPEGPPGPSGSSILYFTGQPVSVGSNAQIMRIPVSGTDSSITTDTVVLECEFSDSDKIESDVTWQSFDGYITFIGTCTGTTTADITLGDKAN